MSETASISTGIAQRYATAVYELAQEAKALPQIEKDLDALQAALAESEDFRDLINSPIYTREQQAASISAIAKKMDLSQHAGTDGQQAPSVRPAAAGPEPA